MAACIDFVSTRLFSDATYRRRLIQSMLDWLKSNRGWQDYDSVLGSGLLEVCENTRSDAASGRHVPLLPSQREALASSRLHTLQQTARNQIFADLKSSARIETDTQQWKLRYKPLHNVLPADLGCYLALFTHGIPQAELADAYPGVAADISALLDSGSIYAIEYKEKSTATGPSLVLFPREEIGVKIDEEMQEMWHKGIEDMPKGNELDFALFNQGHLSKDQFVNGHLFKAREQAQIAQAAAAAAQAAAADRKLKRKRTSRGALTNMHLVGKFAFLAEMTATKKK